MSKVNISTPWFLTKAKASHFLTNTLGLPVAVKTLNTYITQGKGPKFYKFGPKTVVYTAQDLVDWAYKQLSNQCSSSNHFIDKKVDIPVEFKVFLQKEDSESVNIEVK